VIVASESILLNLAKDDLLAEVDDTIVDLSQVLPQFRHPNGVGVEIGAYVLAHTPGSFEGEGPQTWADLFDLEKFPGKRMLQNAPTPTLEVALLADGVPKEELYPLDVERALAKLDTIKDETIFFTSHSQSQQLIIDGAVTCGFMYAARAYGANRDGADIAVSWDGNLMSMTPIFVPKNIENKDICWALVNEFLNPENQARMAELFVSAPSNPDAMPLISDEIRKWLPTEGDNLEKGVMLNAEYWRDNLESVLRRWQTWLLT
jgi:putative spermidine/putrescine transport system substrate-binding protein